LGSCEPNYKWRKGGRETLIQSFRSGTSPTPRDYKKVLFLSNDSLLFIFCSIRNQSGGQDDCIKKWNAIFLLLCVIAVLCVDPWFLYLPVINQDDKCLTLDKRLMVIALCFRSVFDMIYVGKIILKYFSRTQEQTGPIKKDLRLYFEFAIDILAILPIPEVKKTFLLPKLLSFPFLFFYFFKFNYAMRNSIIDS